VRGSLVNAIPVSGLVLVDGKLFLSPAQIQVGVIIDTRGGSIELITSDGTATFSGGIFRLVQPADPAQPTDLVLTGGVPTTVCGTAAKKAAAGRKPAASLRPKVLNLLRGNGKGKFRTRARYSSATVRGTVWLVAERCDGSFSSVSDGSIAVFDQVRRRTIILTAHHSYLAKPKK
jgi:hypothetical protein